MNLSNIPADERMSPRTGEELDKDKLASYLKGRLHGFGGELVVSQYTGGYSNLTYHLQWNGGSCVLRRPPIGADVKGGHDMLREFHFLQALHPHFPCMPRTILSCEDPEIMGAPFFVMEHVPGLILRGSHKNLEIEPQLMRRISENAVRMLVRLHHVDANAGLLLNLGKPEGYVQRQTVGWIERYRKAATDEVDGVEEVISWMTLHMPSESRTSIIHNDYKYDNIVLDPNNPTQILAVLDWEMATKGESLLDLGTCLAYWCEEHDHPALKPFNTTWMPGNLNREEVVRLYAQEMGINHSEILFPYVFGCFKVAVIVQQIYSRYRKGFTKDQRFAGLKHVLAASVQQAVKAIQTETISS